MRRFRTNSQGVLVLTCRNRSDFRSLDQSRSTAFFPGHWIDDARWKRFIGRAEISGTVLRLPDSWATPTKAATEPRERR
jgi:hypothetical protein